jgi:hypothetical protein
MQVNVRRLVVCGFVVGRLAVVALLVRAQQIELRFRSISQRLSFN